MLIDSNAYIGHWPFRQFKYNNLEALSGRMREFGTNISVISNLNGIFYKNTQHANEELYQTLRSKRIYRNQFIPFAVINPIYAGWREDFEKCTSKMGMKGVRLYPNYHLYDIIDPSCVELVKMCRDKEIPVAFSVRMVDSRPSSWMDLEKTWTLSDIIPIVKEVPDAKYLIYNVTSGTGLDKEHMALLKKAQIMMDTSGRSISDLPGLLTKYGKDKFCFGTHSPILDYCSGLLRIEALRESEADKNTEDLLRSINIMKMLNI